MEITDEMLKRDKQIIKECRKRATKYVHNPDSVIYKISSSKQDREEHIPYMILQFYRQYLFRKHGHKSQI